MKNNTINKKEIEKFSKIAEEWWDPDGKFKPLHNFNPIRISYLKENIIKTFNLKGFNYIIFYIGNSNWIELVQWFKFTIRIPPFFSNFRKFFYFFFINCVIFHK